MINFFLELDQKIFIFIHHLNFSFLNPLMTSLSSKIIWIPLVLFFLFFSLKKLTRRNFILFLLFNTIGLVLSDVTSSYILKNYFNRLRPCREEFISEFIISFGQKCGGKFGFVSSHASNSLVFVLFCFISLKLNKKWFLLLFLPLLVGYSRIYLGVHYPGDILGGYLVGLVWALFLGWSFFKITEQDETSPS